MQPAATDTSATRRGFLKGLGAAAVGAAIVPVEAVIPAEAVVPAVPELTGHPDAPPGTWVHWVAEDRRHIVGQVRQMLPDGTLEIVYEIAPRRWPLGTPSNAGLALTRVRMEPAPVDGKVRAGTWHLAEGCLCGRSYGEVGRRVNKSLSSEELLQRGVRPVFLSGDDL